MRQGDRSSVPCAHANTERTSFAGIYGLDLGATSPDEHGEAVAADEESRDGPSSFVQTRSDHQVEVTDAAL